MRKLLIGRLLVIAGVALLALWMIYFVQLVRPVDAWDFCPLPVALGLIVVGMRFAGLGQLVLAQAGVSHKRDLVLAMAFGTLAELSLWGFLFFKVDDAETAERYIQLERLQEPGLRVAEAIYRHSYAHLGRTGSLWVAGAGAFTVLIAIWSLGAFTVLRMVRFLLRLTTSALKRRCVAHPLRL